MSDQNAIRKSKDGRFQLALLAFLLGFAGQVMLNENKPAIASGCFILAVVIFIRIIKDRKRYDISPSQSRLDFKLQHTTLIVICAIVSFIFFTRPAASAYAWFFHIVSVILLLYSTSLGSGEKAIGARFFSRWEWTELFSLGAILVIGALVRFIRLDQLPFGFWYDEAVNGINAIRILDQPDFRPVMIMDTNLPAHFNYLIALSTKIFGASVFSVRFVSALFGLATVAAAYFAGSELFNRRLGLIFALFIALSRWDITWSRIGMHGVSVPFFELLSIGCLLRALRTKLPLFYALTGLMLGFGLLFYYPLRFFPLVVAIFILFLIWKQPGFFRNNRAGLALIIFSMVIAALPLIQFAIDQPSVFFARINQTSIFADNPGSQALPAVIRSAQKHLLMFNMDGDNNGRHNLSGMPMLDLVSGAMLVIGALLSIWHIRKSKFFLIMLWFIMMLLPGIFSLEFEAPQSYRAIGSLPAVYLLAMVPLYHFSELIREEFDTGKRFIYYLLIFAICGYMGVSNLSVYFNYQARDDQSWLSHSTRETIIGKRIAALGNDTDFYVNSFYHGTPTITFIAPNISTYKNIETYDPIPFKLNDQRDAAIFLDAEQTQSFELAKKFYPSGEFTSIKSPAGETILYEILLSVSDIREKQGLTASYYTSDSFEGQPAVVRQDQQLDLASTANPSLVYPYAVEWRGVLNAYKYGMYRFSFKSSQEVELLIDQREIDWAASQDGDEGIVLARGLHEIRIRTIATGAPIYMDWQPPDEEMQPLTSATLFDSSITVNGLTGNYYNNQYWEGEAVYAQIDPFINFYYHNQPLPRPYSVEWTGEIDIPTDGEYVFELMSIDDSKLYLDGELVIEKGSGEDGQAATLTLERGRHPIRILFADYSSRTQIRLAWVKPGGVREYIPSQMFYPN